MPTVKVEGLQELSYALGQLPKAVGKGVLRRILRKRAKPVADTMRRRAPRDKGQLADSISVSTKISKRQRRLERRTIDRDSVNVYAGPTQVPQAGWVEFGSVHNTPKPFMRPAWDQHKMAALDGIGRDIGNEIARAANRIARRKG